MTDQILDYSQWAIVIPARMASTRLPRKPLAMIAGQSMISRVALNAKKSELPVYVATDDQEIVRHLMEYSIPTLYSDQNFETGTERVAWAAQELRSQGSQGKNLKFVMNVQGDEPLIDGQQLKKLAIWQTQHHKHFQAGTLVTQFHQSWAHFANPGVVKVMYDPESYTCYGFSRSLFPFPRDLTHQQLSALYSPSLITSPSSNSEVLPPSSQLPAYWQHIGVYSYDIEILPKILKFGATTWENTEKLEQLRLYPMNIPIGAIVYQGPSVGVDFKEDIHTVETLLKSS